MPGVSGCPGAVQVKGEGKDVENSLGRASEKSDNFARSTYDKGASKVEHAKDKIHGAGHSAKEKIHGAGHSAKRCAMTL